MKILITGGTGFIGQNLKEQLSSKYEILAPATSDLNLLNGDSVSDYLKRHNFDVVIHTATWNATRNSPKDITRVLENNLRMFFNLARSSGSYGKMIYYGSGAEFDRTHWVPKMDEEYFDTRIPADEYGFSKYIMSKYTEKLGGNIYNLRLFGVFGKYEDWTIRFISNACCKAVLDLPITIKQNVAFDYLYIDDLVNVTQWFMENDPKEHLLNVCTGTSHDLTTLAKKVLTVSGKNIEIKIANKGLGREYSGNNARLLKEMSGYQFSDIDDSVKGLYYWYLENKSSLNRNKLLYDK